MKTKNERQLLSHQNKTRKCPTNGYSTSHTHTGELKSSFLFLLILSELVFIPEYTREGVDCHSRERAEMTQNIPQVAGPVPQPLLKQPPPPPACPEENPIQILFAREKKVRETNPQEDLKLQLTMPLQRAPPGLWGQAAGLSHPTLPSMQGNACLAHRYQQCLSTGIVLPTGPHTGCDSPDNGRPILTVFLGRLNRSHA